MTVINKSHLNNHDKMNALAKLVCFRIEELFDKLELELRMSGKLYLGCCPIHMGDNPSAINLYPEGDKAPGIWFCKTKKCHEVFGRTILGFIRGVLSQRYFGWNYLYPKENLAPFDKTVGWICKFVGQSLDEIKIEPTSIEIHQFAAQIAAFKQVTKEQSGISREMFRRSLQFPAQYYVSRKYQPATLDKFDVGLCIDKNNEFFNRIVVPIYDEKHRFVVGSTARSRYEKCPKCNVYHNPKIECPINRSDKRCSKWLHQGHTASHLYGYWFATKQIREVSTAILVEGPGDVWRLHEAGIDNAVAMFGNDLSDEQQILLERSGALNVIVIRDNDAAGEACEKKLQEQIGRMYNKLRFIVPSTKDIGEMSVEQIKQEVLPQL